MGEGSGLLAHNLINALLPPPRFLCCSLHAFSVCVIVHLELWFSYFFFSFLFSIWFFSPFSLLHPLSFRSSVLVLYVLLPLLTHVLPGPCW